MVYELRQEFKITTLLEVSGMSRSTYYYHISNKEKTDKYESEKDKIEGIYRKNRGRYGYRRITAEIRKLGIKINHKTVQRLMKELKLTCKVRMKKYKSYRGEVGKIAPNLLKRNFEATKPNEKWVTDVTEFALLGQKLYLSPILDLYNGEIISYNISQRPVFAQIEEMLANAFKRLDKKDNLILHSDQGWQYQMKRYQNLLKSKGIRQSMSRKGNCLDNAVMENFFGHLKAELFYLEEFQSIDEFIDEIHNYIKYYNYDRIKSRLNYLSPVEFRKIHCKPA